MPRFAMAGEKARREQTNSRDMVDSGGIHGCVNLLRATAAAGTICLHGQFWDNALCAFGQISKLILQTGELRSGFFVRG